MHGCLVSLYDKLKGTKMIFSDSYNPFVCAMARLDCWEAGCCCAVAERRTNHATRAQKPFFLLDGNSRTMARKAAAE